jgi:iron complex outermembrane recepter protein
MTMKLSGSLTILLVLLFESAGAQQATLPDSTRKRPPADGAEPAGQKTYQVKDVTVYAVRAHGTTTGTAASITAMGPREFYRGNDIAFQDILNVVPGVRLESETPAAGSAVSIRGMGGMSTRGMRDVRIFYNGIPVSGADGSSYLDDIDFSAFGSGTVIKGPGSLQFGASPAGTLIFDTKKARYQEMDLNHIVTSGADGLLRTNTNYRAGTDKSNMYISYGTLSYDGYREHSKASKEFLTLSGVFFPDEKQTVSVLVTASSLDARIPGELTAAQVDADPRMANSAFIRNDAGTVSRLFWFGVTHDYSFSRAWQYSLTAFGGSRQFKDRFIPYNQEMTIGTAGIRSSLTYLFDTASVPLQLSLGGELSHDADADRRHGSDSAGLPLPYEFDRDYGLVRCEGWVEGIFALANRMTLTGGLRVTGFNGAFIDNGRYSGADKSSHRLFAPYCTPLVSLIDSLDDSNIFYAMVAGGYSVPTVRELTSDSLAVNTAIQPEKTMNYEAGIRGAAMSGRLHYAVSVFDNELANCFVPEMGDGIVTITGAAGAHNRGAEVMGDYTLFVPGHPLFSGARVFASLLYDDFRFTGYNPNGADFSGKQFPGLPQFQFNAGLDLSLSNGGYFNLSWLVTGERPVDDANATFAEGFELVNLRGGWRKRLAKPFTLQVYGGIDNLADERYAASLALNPTAFSGNSPLLYNPAQGRNGYVALNVEFHFAE